MGIKKTSLIGKYDNYNDLFDAVKDWFDTNMPNFFTNITVYHDPSTSQPDTRGYHATITFSDANQPLYMFRVEAFNSAYSRTLLVLRSYIVGGFYESHTNTFIYDSDNHYYNYIAQIYKIRDDVVGISICNNTTYNSIEDLQPGVIIFAKTQNGDIAVVRPTVFSNTAKYNYDSSTKKPNNIFCTTINSVGSTYYHDNMSYEQVSAISSVLCPIDVVGCDDHIPNAYVVPLASTIISNCNDGYLKSGLRVLYYTGKLAFDTNQMDADQS